MNARICGATLFPDRNRNVQSAMTGGRREGHKQNGPASLPGRLRFTCRNAYCFAGAGAAAGASAVGAAGGAGGTIALPGIAHEKSVFV